MLATDRMATCRSGRGDGRGGRAEGGGHAIGGQWLARVGEGSLPQRGRLSGRNSRDGLVTGNAGDIAHSETRAV